MQSRTWAEIDTDALTHNFKEIRKITNPNSKILAVVKADAYGHGVEEVAKTLIKSGADYFAVACADEGKQLRRAGIILPILILGASSDEDIDDIIDYSLMPTVFNREFAETISKKAADSEKDVKIHIKLDTGMSRIGYVAGNDDDALTDEILWISALPHIKIEGIFSHFSTSDEYDKSYTLMQFDKFMKVCDILEEKGLHIPIKHIANSAAIMMYPQTHLDMVRAGIILYGLYPSEEVDKSKINLVPVMTLKSRITMIKTLGAGCGISYGKTYITNHDTKIATVPIGYADGYTRLLSGSAEMIAKNTPVPVIGRICMDQCMIDVTSVNNINTGDEVIVFGAGAVTADNLAEWIGSVNYEIVCMISKRIPRIYIKNGKAVKTLNYLNRI